MINDETPDYPSLETQLFHAIAIDDCCRAFDLIRAGADLSAFDWFGWTPLQCAETYEMVELLIQNGADPDQLDNKGRTAWKTASPQMLAHIRLVHSDLAYKTLAGATAEAPRRYVRRF